MIESEQLEQDKNFDIFVSHSSYDRSDVIDFSKLLNDTGLHTYVDWISDLHFLKRDFLGRHTVDVLLNRLRQSKILIYYHTQSSESSYWIPWEIGYFMGMKKNIFIYNPHQLPLPQYLVGFQTLVLTNGVIFIKDSNNKLDSDYLATI